MRKFITKLMALATTFSMLLTMSSEMALASNEESTYLGSTNCKGSYTTYTREAFLADFEKAKNTAVLDFEEGKYSNAATKYLSGSEYGDSINGANISITGVSEAELNIYHCNLGWPLTNAKSGLTSTNISTDFCYSGSKSLAIWSSNKYSYFAFGYEDAQGQNSSLYTTSLIKLRPTKVGFMVSTGTYQGTDPITVKMKYSDGTTSTEETIVDARSLDSNMGNTAYFVGMKVPSGKYIEHIAIQTKAAAKIDNLCVIMSDPTELPDECKTDSIEVYGESSFAQPAYNSVAKYTYSAVAKDKNQNALSPEIKWTLEGDYYGDNVTIGNDGVLMVKRDFNPENKIKIVACVHDEVNNTDVKSAPFEVAVTPVEPYLRSDRIVDSKTTYTRNNFLKDMEHADHIAVLNFEDAETGKNFSNVEGYADTTIHNGASYKAGARVPVTNGGNIDIYWQYKKDIAYKVGFSSHQYSQYGFNEVGTPLYAADNPSAQVASGKYGAIMESLADYSMFFECAQNPSLTPIAFGCAFSNAGASSAEITVTLTYSDGTEESEKALVHDTDGKSSFFGFRAPAGKHITKVGMHTNTWCNLDDICIILENTNAEAKARFSKDAASLEPVYEIADAADAKSIYVTLPADSTAVGTLIIAAYDENDGLVGVNTTELKSGKAGVVIPEGKSVKKIKMFVWNNMSTLVPVRASSNIDK